MRFRPGTRVLSAAILCLGIGSCKDLAIPGGGTGVTETTSKISILRIDDDGPHYYVAPVDIVVFDEAHPLASGGLASGRVDFPEFVEFEDIPAGTYSIALVNVSRREGSGILPNLDFDDIELPGEIALRVEIPPISGRFNFPPGFVSEPDSKQRLLLSWQSVDPRSGRSYTLTHVSEIAADGTVSARVMPGSYASRYERVGPGSAMHHDYSEAVELLATSSFELELPLSEFAVQLAGLHPDFPDSLDLEYALEEGPAFFFLGEDWHERTSADAFPRSAWLRESVYKVKLESWPEVFFPRDTWWDSSDLNTLILRPPVYRLRVLLRDEDAAPLYGIAVTLRRDRRSIAPRTDIGGTAVAFLDPGNYSVEIPGLAPEILAISGDLELSRVVPTGVP
jgi:hypothetical protein